ncbi:hypothetical protein SAMN05216428_101353 [Nitrosospira sp. Nsp11]|nr:hypothetical protein SAMN05216428_101353 [Nitrosospira sp. Nsp11]
MDDCVLQIIGEIGRHTDVIKAAITASNEEKNKSLRPLKSKLTQFQRRHTELSEKFQRYLKLVRKTDSEHFGQEMLAAAENLAKQKNELEQEIERVKIDIAYRERVVTNEKVIANALLTFEQAVKVLPFDDQRKLLHLLLQQIRANRLNPEKELLPADSQTWNIQIRYELAGIR